MRLLIGLLIVLWAIPAHAAQQNIAAVTVPETLGGYRSAVNERLVDIDENFDELYAWGDHAAAGYLTTYTDSFLAWDLDYDDLTNTPTAADLGALFSGEGTFLKPDGTTGDAATSDTLGELTCLSGQVAVFNGTDWACSEGGSGGGGDMIYPATGVAQSTGSSWGTSLTVGTGASNLVQLNSSSQLPAVSAALLTNFPTLDQNTTGTAAGLSSTLAVTSGGTGATSAGAARTALGVVPGTDVQAYDADLTTYAGITPSANIQTLLGATNYAAVRQQLDLEVGTDVLAPTGSAAGLTSFPTLNQNTTGTAANVSGTVAVANGGTGATSAADARTALGLVIGTNVLAPNGSAASLTSFPTLNQNTSGTAAGLSSTLAVASGGTGSTSATNARTALGLVIGTDVLAPAGSAASLTSFPTLNQNTTGTAAGLSSTLAIASGGTGATSAGAARTALSLVPGVNVQAYDIDLNTLSAPTAHRMFYSDASSVMSQLAHGTTGQVLTAQGATTAPAWSTLGAAASLDATNGTIGDVITWVDGGSCSDPAYTTEATCVAETETWTPLASAPIDAASGAITDSGNLITATTIEGALAEHRAAINLNTAKVTNTDNQTATQVPVTATGFTGNLSGTDTNVQTALATIDAMTVSGSDTLGDLSCTTDQVAKWNGTAWACAADATAAGAGYVSTVPTYSDEACTAGQYAFSTTTGYVCVSSGDWNTFALTNWSAPTPDTTPDDFSFTNQTDVEISTTITSARVQITGINTDTEVSATGGTAAICTSAAIEDCGTFGAAPGDVTNEQYVAARHTSSGSASTAVDTVVTVGTMERTFRSTTAAGGCAYDVCETFDGTTIPSGWTEVENSTSTVDWSADGVVTLDGDGISAGSYIYYDMVSSGNSLYMGMKLQIDETDTAAASTLVNLQQANGSGIAKAVRTITDGYLRAEHGGVSDTSTTVPPTLTDIWVWVEAVRSTGTDGIARVYYSTTSTKPGSPTAEVTTGDDGDTLLQQVRIHAMRNGKITVDTVWIDQTDPIGNM